jgi:beta-1,4-mannosyl-glycoprotein beta-1,4-N-acetylglucosaminyltransferase
MIWDCFTYNGEEDLLKIRCEELSGLDVTHILVESNYTFTGKWKSLSYKTKLPYKIEHFVANHLPNNGNAWENEKEQRNHILFALTQLGASDNDIVIISDADEIIRRSTIENYNPISSLTALKMDTYRYYFNCLEGKQNWDMSRVMNFSYLKDKTPDFVRNSGFERVIHDAGWHFSYMGGYDKIIEKIESFSHTELNTEEFKSKIKYKQESCQSLFGDDFWQIVQIDNSFPIEVLKNIKAYQKHIK